MQHIYQKLFHKINESQNLTYSLEYDEATFLNLFVTIYCYLHEPKLYAQVHDVLMKYTAMKHKKKLKMISLAL